MIQFCLQIIHYDLGRTYKKLLLVRKSKKSITKLSETKLRQTAKISALSSRNVSKFEFLTGKDNYPKDLLEKLLQ